MSKNNEILAVLKKREPILQTERLSAYIPELCCFDDFYSMLSNSEFIACYGVNDDKEKVQERLRYKNVCCLTSSTGINMVLRHGSGMKKIIISM